jgi:hypothetical protein
LPKTKKAHKDQRKRASQTEIYRLPKEIFVFEETTTTKVVSKPYADKKQMPEVVVIKDESRHEDDDNESTEKDDHERRSHPKSPRPLYRGRKFTFEGISPGGTKSLQSGELEEATGSYKPLIFVKKIPLVHEENSTIESINSTGYDRGLTPMSNVFTLHDKPIDYSLKRTFSGDAKARMDELLSALPTPHASNSAFSGERTAEGKGNAESTPISSMLNPFPFDEAVTVQAGRLSSENLADHDEEQNYYSEPKPVSSDEADPDWYIEFQIKNGIIAENTGPDDDESVTIGDCNATFKDMCGISAQDDNQNTNFPSSASVALSNHLKESGLGQISSYVAVVDLKRKLCDTENHATEKWVGATEGMTSESRRDKPATKPNGKAQGTGGLAAVTKEPALPFITLETGNDPPSTIEILLKESLPKAYRQEVIGTNAAAPDVAEEVSLEEFKNNPDAQSHETGPSDLTASSRSIETGNLQRGWARTATPDLVNNLPSIETAPSDEMGELDTKSKEVVNDTTELGLGKVQEEQSRIQSQDAIRQPEPNAIIPDAASAKEPLSPPATTSTPPVKSEKTSRGPALGFRKHLARKFVRQAIPMGYSQAYLKSSTTEVTTKISNLRTQPPVVQTIIEGGVAAEKNSLNKASISRNDTRYDIDGHHNYGIDRKLKYVRPDSKEVGQPINLPRWAYEVGETSLDSHQAAYAIMSANIFGCVEPSEPTRAENASPIANNDDQVNTACLLDSDDTHSISPAPSDEFEQRIAYNGCDMSAAKWGPAELAPETTSNLFPCENDEDAASGQVPDLPNEPEVVAEAEKLQGSAKDCTELLSEDDSIFVAEQRDDTDDRDKTDAGEAWMDDINTMVCGK